MDVDCVKGACVQYVYMYVRVCMYGYIYGYISGNKRKRWDGNSPYVCMYRCTCVQYVYVFMCMYVFMQVCQ